MVLVYMLTSRGYIDGIHGTPYIAAPWIRHGIYIYIYPLIIYIYIVLDGWWLSQLLIHIWLLVPHAYLYIYIQYNLHDQRSQK